MAVEDKDKDREKRRKDIYKSDDDLNEMHFNSAYSAEEET